jgi:hypothetical protein
LLSLVCGQDAMRQADALCRAAEASNMRIEAKDTAVVSTHGLE